MLTSDDVARAVFPTVTWREGYETDGQDAVDAFLDQASQALASHGS